MQRSRQPFAVVTFVVGLAAAARANGPVVEQVTVLHTFAGAGGNDRLGWAIENVGDLDGDGVADLIAGAPFGNSGGTGSGRAVVYSGASGAILFAIDGAAGDALGFSVNGA